MPRIVYLEPVRGASFRSRLRSDTLWGALCWNILALYGKPALESFIESYKHNEAPLRISSAFPWAEADEQRHHFLPYPTVAPAPADPPSTTDPKEIKAYYRKRKEQEKGKTWISWATLSKEFGGDGKLPVPKFSPAFDQSPTTHNLIDRRRLGTLTINNDGQLFHTLESNYRWRSTEKDTPLPQFTNNGLYFLVEGEHDYLEPALRHLSVNGLGGDRSIGKGHFRVYFGDADLPRVPNANASLNLSLYHPAEIGEDILGGTNDALLRYHLEDRQGRSLEDSERKLAGMLYFAEGSVFPKGALPTGQPGHLVPMRTHRFGHQIYRYGYALTIDLQIPPLA